MLVAGSILSTPLAAQSSFGIGVAATLGGSWQIEGGDVAWVGEIHAGPLRYVSVGGRVGVFVDESAITGGTRGVVGGLVLQTRTGLVNVADVGNESNPSALGFDVTFEGVGYTSANAPSQFGTAWGAVSVLPGLRIGTGGQIRYGVVFGPTLFIGKETEWRAFLALRFEVPVGRSKSNR
jgi:hypothetical protein